MSLYEDWLSVAKEIAIEAGRLINKMALESPAVTHKGPVDIVTEADVKAEELIVGRLREAFPSHGILAEESGGDRDKEFLWIIDPIDGTTNYAHGFPVYAVSIGLFVNKAPALGVVFEPNVNELFAAVSGEGATLNGAPINVSKVVDISQALLATGFPYTLRDDPDRIMRDFANVYLSSQGVRRAGAASVDLCNVACGRFDGFWEVGLKPWDTAAAGLIVEEAGGLLSDYAGDPFDHFLPRMVASNGLIHRQLLDILQKT